jgi:hypothetical protein
MLTAGIGRAYVWTVVPPDADLHATLLDWRDSVARWLQPR